MIFDSSDFPGSGAYSWKWSWIRKESTPGRLPPPPPATNDEDQQVQKDQVVNGYDLRASSFQDYLLDLVTLAGICAPVGDLEDANGNPVANWLRAKGLRLLFSDTEGRYIVLIDRGPTKTGTLLCALPDYLSRYLELLADDAFTERLVPAYQALALLTYVVTTERYKASDMTA